MSEKYEWKVGNERELWVILKINAWCIMGNIASEAIKKQ